MRVSMLALVLGAAASLPAFGAASESAPTPATTSEPVPGEDSTKGAVIAQPERQPAPKRVGTPAVAPTPAPATDDGDVDMVGDRPQAGVTPEKKKPLLEEFEATGPVDAKAKKCYDLLSEIKANVDLISKDLDNAGKEVTRLINTSDTLAKNITKLANLWPEEEKFRDRCGTAKRQALDLNEELSRVPRIWTHVRWGFDAVVQHTRDIRIRARALADAEEKPVAVVKDGKTTYVDSKQPVDPIVARKEAILKADEETLAKQRKDKESREKPMRQDVDH